MRLIDADKLKQHYANCLESAEQIAAGTYKNFDYYVLNIKTHYVARQDMRKEDEGKWQKY